MPTYRITDPKTGRTLRLTGDSPPSAQEIEQALSAVSAPSTPMPDVSPMASHAPSTQSPGKQRWDEAVALADADRQQRAQSFNRMMGGEQIAQGFEDVTQGQYARGAHNMLVGGGTAALMLNPYGAARTVVQAPVRTALSLATGYAGQQAGEAVGERAGLTEDQTRLVGDIGMVAGGSIPLLMRGPQGSVTVPSPFRNTNPAERAAVEFGQRSGVPVDAATATDNTYVRGIQRGVVDRTVGGSVVAARSRRRATDALERTGRQIADRVSPSASSPEAAGEAVQSQVTRQVTDSAAAATKRYAELDTLAKAKAKDVVVGTKTVKPTGPTILDASGKPIPRTATTVPIVERMAVPVDITAEKKALKPLHERLMREAKITPLMGDKGRAANALDRLMNAPDVAPLSVVDTALGDLKAMARTADLPELRTQGQGLAATVVQQLEQRVRKAAADAGPDVLEALMQGRLATRAKWGAQGTRDLITQSAIDEPVKAYRALTQPNDASIERLREVARIAPQQVREVGRAWLDSAMEKATAAGGFDRSDALWRDWQSLGPSTKRIIFGDPKVVADLDKFFLLTKKMAEQPNPSGTATTLFAAGEGGMLMTNPVVGVPLSLSAAGVAKLLRNPRAVRLLNEGLQLQVGSSRMRPAKAIAVELLGLSRRAGAQMVPVTADQQSEPSTRPPAR